VVAMTKSVATAVTSIMPSIAGGLKPHGPGKWSTGSLLDTLEQLKNPSFKSE
jgi:hypothetical protein